MGAWPALPGAQKQAKGLRAVHTGHSRRPAPRPQHGVSVSPSASHSPHANKQSHFLFSIWVRVRSAVRPGRARPCWPSCPARMPALSPPPRSGARFVAISLLLPRGPQSPSPALILHNYWRESGLNKRGVSPVDTVASSLLYCHSVFSVFFHSVAKPSLWLSTWHCNVRDTERGLLFQ